MSAFCAALLLAAAAGLGLFGVALSASSGALPMLVGAMLCELAALLFAAAIAWRLLRQLRRARAEARTALERAERIAATQQAAQAASARQLAQARLQQAGAERSSRSKDDFIGMLDHELRNPLGVISSAARLLLHERAGAEASRHALDIIERQTARLGQLLKDLADAAQVVSGELALERHAADLARLAGSAVTALRVEGVLNQHELALQLQPAWIDADGLRIEQAVSHLLTAALRRLPIGSRVVLEVRPEAGQAVLSLRRERPAGQPRMLDFFAETTPSATPESRQPGLGPSLARSLVELHGGSATADPAEGHDAFTLRLPAIAAPQASTAPVPRVRARSVSVVQPDREAAAALGAMLAVDGHHTSQNSDATRGLRAIIEQRPDVAIVDLALPGQSAFDLARRSRAAGYAGLMIAISAAAPVPDPRLAMQAGFDVHLPWPVDAARLRELMSQRW